jgi:hypothetical protein
VVAGAAAVSYVTADGDPVELCTTVDFTSDDTPTDVVCVDATPTDEVTCLVESATRDYPLCWVVRDLLDEVWTQVVDPVLCPILGGDVVVAGQWLYACPPP